MGKVKRLICVEVGGSTKQSNKFYNMTEVPGDSFEVEYGRVGKTKIKKSYPMRDWDKILRSKLKKYDDITHLHETEEIEISSSLNVDDPDVKKFIEILQGFSTAHVKSNYSVSASKVTQAMIDRAQKILNQLPSFLVKKDKAEINKNLLELYKTIPREMKDVTKNLIQSLQDREDKKTARKMFESEQETLDTMASQVKIQTASQVVEIDDTPFLESLGLEIVPATDTEIKEVRDLMYGANRNFHRMFKVINKSTEGLYQDDLAKCKGKSRTEQLFFHGSRNQNWMSILMNGLLIRPSGAIHTGSMFGDGIYGANKARKALGYCSLSGSYWAKGSGNVGYMGVYSFRVGKQKNIKNHNSSCYTLNKSKLKNDGFDSVYAHGGADLRNDEFIVYDNAQTTIRYIIELKPE